MARKPNYSYEKRQKELLKQRKKEEKKQRKLDKLNNPVEDRDKVGTTEADN